MSIQETADRFLGAWGARDWDALGAIMASDAVWTMPGSGTLSGTVRGSEAVLDRARFIAGGGVNTEFERALTGGQGVALILRNTAQRGDATLDEHLATVLTIIDDHITRIDTYLSDVAMKDAFFGENVSRS